MNFVCHGVCNIAIIIIDQQLKGIVIRGKQGMVAHKETIIEVMQVVIPVF